MRSTKPADLSTRARIRDAAVLRFARSGFGASVRTIAKDAGVSAGLVMHHFGTKDGLRAACDEHVRSMIRQAKLENTERLADGRGFLQVFATSDGYGPLVGYVLRSLQDGSAVGREFIEQMIDDAVGYTAAAVEAGIAKPSIDERARARYLATSALGALLVGMTLDPPADDEDMTVFTSRYFAKHYLPMVELYTQGFLTTRQMLDDYLLYVSDPPAANDGAEPDGDAVDAHAT